jgi:two-component system NtrC family sensor kinase
MEEYLRTLREASEAFVDVGFFDAKGIQIGYAGPFPFLQGKDYSREAWFATLMRQERNYHVSDVYLGFRDKPHFTIAVRLLIEGRTYVMRATLDPNKFNRFLGTISRGKGIDSALINETGSYQVVDPARGEPLQKTDYLPTRNAGSGVEEIRLDGDAVVVAYSWLKETPWVLVIRQPLSVTYAEMYQVRRIMIISTALIVLVIAGSAWWITDRLVKRAHSTAEAREELRSQLLHASKLASVGELAAGVAHEINNPLAIIGATSGVIRDMLDPQFDLDNRPESIREELDTIDTAVYRARDIIDKLMKFSRKNDPRMVPCNLNKLLDEVVEWFKERAFQVSDVELVRDYDADLPEICVDPDQIRQVFLNLINNADDAIDGAGTIRLSTRCESGFVRVEISDTGKGMTPEQMEKIFLPFYTTKEVGRGTGLGLSISLSIVESMGGSIAVQSMLGAGSSFTVRLPTEQTEDRERGSAS